MGGLVCLSPRGRGEPQCAAEAGAARDGAANRLGRGRGEEAARDGGAGRSPIRVDLARPPESHPIRIEPPPRQPGTRDRLADEKNSYRAKLAKPPRFGPKVHAAIAEEMYKTI